MAETAREYFEDVADAVRQHRQAELILAFGPPRRGGAGAGISDPVAARAASDESARATMDATEQRIGEGLRRIGELRRIFARMADVVEMHYVDLMPWGDVADEIGISRVTVIRWNNNIMDFIDQTGWAHLRNCGDGS